MIVALSIAGFTLFGTSVNESAAPSADEDTAQVLPPAPSMLPTAPSIATLPTTTPLRETPVPVKAAAPRAGYAAASLPSLDPQRTIMSLPTVTPSREAEPARIGCDPAYPDERTCIPPGPPFDQGCAITDERLFTVLAPDPQELDYDRDGIGCEPLGSRS